MKLLAVTYEPQQIVWFRIGSHLLLVAAVFMPRMGLGLLRTRRIGTQFVSLVMMLLSTLFLFPRSSTCPSPRRSPSPSCRRSPSCCWPVLGAILMSLWLPFVWKAPIVWTDWALLCSLGVFGALGHYCVAKAMTYASANFVAPFNYTQMIGSVIVGYFMFAEVPDFYTWLGTAVIVGAGLMVSWQGRKPQKS
ncbi:MAG: DMT family transporter [Reyranella sp.]|nr:DMT family transporter [Reyranella sp.]